MTITVLLDIKTTADKVEDMKQWMIANIPDTRARPGAGAMTLLLDQEDPTHFIVHEIWDSKEDQQAYLAWRSERGDMEVLGAMFAGPPGFTYLDDAEI